MTDMLNEKAAAELAADLLAKGKFVETGIGSGLGALSTALNGQEVMTAQLMQLCFLAGLEYGVSSVMALAAFDHTTEWPTQLAKEMDTVRQALLRVLMPDPQGSA